MYTVEGLLQSEWGTHDMRNMIYIFISGYYIKYRKNIYRTLFSPSGTINSYVFKDSGLTTVCNTIKRQRFRRKKVLIVFVDRYGGDDENTYVYYPIREAVLKKYKKGADGPDRVTFYVELGEYVFPKKWEDIQADILRLSNIPRKSPDSFPTKDGQYITFEENIIARDRYYFGNNGWSKAVETLHTKQAFLAIEKEKLDDIDSTELANMVPFFYRLEFEKKGLKNYKRIRPTRAPKGSDKGLGSSFHCSPKAEYFVQIYYYFPFWAKNNSVKIHLNMKNASTQAETPLAVLLYTNEMEQCRGHISQSFSIPANSGEFSFDVEAQGLEAEKTLVNFAQNINIQLQHHKVLKWFLIMLCAVMYVFCGFLLDYFSLPQEQSMHFLAYCAGNWCQLATNVIQILTVIVIALLNGGEGLLP